MFSPPCCALRSSFRSPSAPGPGHSRWATLSGGRRPGEGTAQKESASPEALASARRRTGCTHMAPRKHRWHARWPTVAVTRRVSRTHLPLPSVPTFPFSRRPTTSLVSEPYGSLKELDFDATGSASPRASVPSAPALALTCSTPEAGAQPRGGRRLTGAAASSAGLGGGRGPRQCVGRRGPSCPGLFAGRQRPS